MTFDFDYDDDQDTDLDDDNRVIDVHLDFFRGWESIPVQPPIDEKQWATDYLMRVAPQLRRNRSALVTHLVQAARSARRSARPATGDIRLFHPEPEEAVLAILTIGLAPIEFFPRALEDEVRSFELRGTPIGEDERATVELVAGPAARVRNCRATAANAPQAPREVLEGVTYMIQPYALPDFRVVVDSWWTELALGDSLAKHIDLLVQTLQVRVSHDPAALSS